MTEKEITLDLQDYMEMEEQILQAMRASERNLWINRRALESVRSKIQVLKTKK